MISITLAFRNLLRHRRRSLFTAGLAAVAAVAAIVSIGYMSATFYAVAENTVRGGLGHLQIAQERMFDGYEEFPLQHGLSPSEIEAIAQKVQSIESMAELLPRINMQGVISVGDQSLVFIGQAVEPLAERSLMPTGSRVIEGVGLEHVDPDNPYQILVGKELARLLGLATGDSVTLMTATSAGGLNAADVTVVGITSMGVKELDRTYVAAPLALAQDLLLSDKIGRLAVVLPDTEKTADVLASFKQVAPPSVTAKSWRELDSFYDQLVQIYTGQFTIFGLVIGAMIVLTLVNTMAMSVLERRKEIATLMAMGFERGYIRRLFVLEGVMLGILGAGVGAALAVALIYLINGSGIQMPPPPGSTEGYTLFLFVEPLAIAGTILTIVILAIAASWVASGSVKQSNLVESFHVA